MVGIIFIGYAAIVKAYVAIKRNIENRFAKQDAIENGNRAYWDVDGAFRLTSNDEQIRYVTLKNGDRTIQTLDGKVLKNYTKEIRDLDIATKNAQMKDDVVLLGRFCDVCADKMGKGIWKHIPKKAAVFVDKDNALYFRESTHGILDKQYVYIRVNDGKYVLFGNPSDREKKWINEKNAISNISSFIHLDSSCEYCK